MRNRHFLSVTVITACISLFCSVTCNYAADNRALPDRYMPDSLDGVPVFYSNPVDGLVVAVWSYWNRTEYDLAVSTQDVYGNWSEPEMIGLHDGLDQIAPAVLINRDGTIYVAFQIEPAGSIYLTAKPAGLNTWTPAAMISDISVRAEAPALRIVGNSLVVAYATVAGTVIQEFPVLQQVSYSSHGIQEGPDAVDPLGNRVTSDIPLPVEGDQGDLLSKGNSKRAWGIGPRKEGSGTHK